ncbi:MAG: diversity-generating retroelement protein Avd [bacterium]|nr:diversity-generating retroelement protein Avd [bacterium]
MSVHNLAIVEKTYELILWLYPVVNRFPKSQRFVLGQHIENTLLDMLENIIAANQTRDKTPHLKHVSVDLDKLRLLVRLAKDLKFMSIKKYAFAAERINEVGRMLGGWIKAQGNG